MAVHFSPDDLRAVYELQRRLRPFKGWRLPPGDEIEFHFVKMRGQDQADCHHNGRRHVIRIASNKHRTLPAVIATMQHEMIHLYLDRVYPQDKAHHGRRFQVRADIVCKIHGWDRGQF